MAVTSQQIAQLAGVSRGTVDRALHNRGRVRVGRDAGGTPVSLRTFS